MLEMLQPYASECGFVTVGVADPTCLVSQSLSWAKSAISCAFPYPNNQLNQPKPVGTGSVASFAAGPDYHQVLTNRLHLLSDLIATDYPGRYSIHVDDSRIYERAIALRSGIGWIGRNQCIFIPSYGSFVVLGEILTDIEFSRSPIIQNSPCGNCTLCIDACPSKSLRQDGSFCRELCISHLTQSRGIIASELLPMIGDQLYGCDVCQSVCPHNQSDVTIDPVMAISCYPGPHPYLSDILQMSSAIWNQAVRDTSVGWIGRNVWKRNAIVVAANQNYLDAGPLLAQLRNDPSPIVSSTASWALVHMFP